MYYVYVLRNPEGILYKGFTEDLQKRILQHNTDDEFSSFTHNRRGPWKLVYSEECNSETEARQREKFFKTGKGREFLKEEIGRLSAQADG